MRAIHRRHSPARSAIAAAALQLLAGTAGAASYSWNIGNLSDFLAANPGADPLAAADTLSIGLGNYKYVNTGLTTAGAVSWQDTLYFQGGSTIANSGSWSAAGNGAFADGGGGGAFINSGLFDAGAFSVAIAGPIAFSNSGTISADSGGSVAINSSNAAFAAGSQFTGSGAVAIDNGAAFSGAFVSQNLQLAAGTFSGSAAQVNGTVAWITGTLAGSWQVATGQTFNLQPGNYKYLNASLDNGGTVNVQDNLYFQNGHALTNEGLVDLQGDVAFLDGGGSGSFVNNGILRKSAGSGTSYLQGISLVNNGEINAQSGTIAFNSGNYTFNDGTLFSGAGQFAVTTSATFAGAFTTNNRLTLSNGVFTGGNGTAGSQATLNGNASWVTGVLAGSWQVPTGQTLTLAAGNYKYLDATLDNQGTLAAQDTVYFQNGKVLTNRSLFDLQGDVGFGDGGGSGSFVNNGILRKSAGSGTSYLQGISLVNNGEINAQSGTIAFNSGNYTFNDGTLFSGAGQFAVTTNATFAGAFTTNNRLTLSNGVFTGGNGTAGSQATLNGNASWVTGVLAGSWQVAGGQTLTLAAGNYKYLNGTLANKGTLAAQDTVFLQNGNLLANQGVLDLQGDVGLGDGGGSGSLVNTGLVVKSAGGGTSNLASVTVTNAAGGTVDVRAGTIQLPNGFSNGGTLKGVGTFATDVLTNAGHVAPGDGIGTLSIAGSFAQTAAGFFDVELAGVTGHDQLAVSGNAALDGTLDLICAGSCTYGVGDRIVIMTYGGSLGGAFAGAPVLSGFGSGSFAVDYSIPGEVVLTVESATLPVPEPGVATMLLSGLGLLGWLGRRRRR